MERGKIKKELLIISCLYRKKKIAGKQKAWDLYDGVVFRTLKKIERERGFPKHLDILILSGKYGFIKPSEIIEYYDYRLKKAEIVTKKDFLLSELKETVKNSKFSEVYVDLGKDYLKSIEGFEKYFSNKTKILFPNGWIGKKMSQVKDWVLRVQNAIC